MIEDHLERLDIQLAEHYVEIKHYDRAIESIKIGLSNQPHHPRLHFLWGVVCYNLMRYEEAFNHLEEAAAYGYPLELVYEFQGYALMDAEEWQRAEYCFLQSLSINPENAEVHAYYAGLMLRLGYWDKGIQLMEEAVRLNPESTEVLRYQHYLELAKQEKREHITLQTLISNADNEFQTLCHLGFKEYYEGHFSKARQHFVRAFEMDPKNSYVLHMVKETSYLDHTLFKPLAWVRRLGGYIFILLYFTVVYFLAKSFYPKSIMWIDISFAAFFFYVIIAHIWVHAGHGIKSKGFERYVMDFFDVFITGEGKRLAAVPRSYDLSSLFLVTFFAGPLAQGLLLSVNSAWLGLSRKAIQSLVTWFGVILTAKVLLALLYYNSASWFLYCTLIPKAIEFMTLFFYHARFNEPYYIATCQGRLLPLTLSSYTVCVFSLALECVLYQSVANYWVK